MAGYNENFLGCKLPLPVVKPERAGDVLRTEQLDGDGLAVYPTYSVLTDKTRRAPIYTVLFIDQKLVRKAIRSDRWRVDQRVGADYQLDDLYYKGSDNRYDKGHSAAREAAAWGKSAREAQTASDETFYYANACLQHDNLNRDEWQGLEDWVLKLDLVKDGKIVVFSGPTYGEFPRTVRPQGRPAADVPAGFFKIVCFMNKSSKKLDVRAFLVMQDEEAIADRQGRKRYNYQHYQVTVAEIEKLTGLDFPNAVYERNPLYYTDNPEARALGATSFPERIDVNSPEDLVGHGDPRVRVEDDNIEVYISAAMVESADQAADGRWVSILNLEHQPVDLKGWKLVDKDNHKKLLDGTLAPGEAKVFKGQAGLGPVRLGSSGGVLTLFNAKGDRVDRVDYTSADVARVRAEKNRPLPIAFATYRS